MSSSSEQYKRFFLEADTDKNGYLSFEELLSMLRRRGYRGSEKKIRKLFHVADSTGDGQISIDEYLISMGEQPEKDHKEALMRNCFKGFDKDANGVIDKDELKQVFREIGRFLSDREAQTMLAIVDADGSGTIDYEEFIAHFFGKVAQNKVDGDAKEVIANEKSE